MRKWIPLLAIVASFAFTAAVYGRLPDQMPVHWNIHGEADRWAGRFAGAFLLPGLALGLWILLSVVPRIDPRRANYAKFTGTYDLVVASIVLTTVGIHLAVLGSAIGWPIPVGRVVPGLAGALLVVIGNALPRARSNWWFGIRTPWTLSNDRVWERTHRLGGYLMVAVGVLLIGAALMPGPQTAVIAIGGIAAMAVISVVYSYVAWRQETSRAAHDGA